MPIFEYRCQKCNETVEKIAREPAVEVPCPRCGEPSRRAVSVFSGSTTDGSVPVGGCAPSSGFT